MTRHPPKPRLAYAVGVTGHRMDRLPDPAATGRAIADVLDRVRTAVGTASEAYRDVFSDVQPRLALVSSLAEGSDRIAAEVALGRDYALEAPLPFDADTYEDDFSDEASRAVFRDMLARADRVLILPGSRKNDAQAYAGAGRAMLNHVDLLIAVWDGGPAHGFGGTRYAIDEAVRRGKPVVVIDATGGSEPEVRWSGLTGLATGGAFEELPPVPLADAIPSIVDQALRPPSHLGGPDTKERAHLAAFYRERGWRVHVRLAYPLLTAALFVRRIRMGDLFPAHPESIARDQPQDATAPKLASAFGWVEALSTNLGQTFRSAFVVNFTFAALAVFMVALSILAKDVVHADKLGFVIVEVLLLAAVVWNTQAGLKREWHRRWVETREATERLRPLPAMRLAGVRPLLASCDEPTWTGWYVRALVREAGLPAHVLDDEGRETARRMLLDLVNDQRGYHRSTAERLRRLDHRLELTGAVLFGVTLLAGLAFIAGRLSGVELPHIAGLDLMHLALTLVTAIGAGLPPLATATYGIRQIGDFRGFADRSESTAQDLDHLAEAIEANAAADISLLASHARLAADVMVKDLESWRTAAESRHLEIPG